MGRTIVRRRQRIRGLFYLSFALLGGCAAGYAIGVGPTVSTEGEVGGQLWLSGHVGFAGSSERGPTMAIEATARATSRPGRGVFTGGGGIGFVQQDDGALVYRIHLMVGAGGTTEGELAGDLTLAGAYSPPRMRRLNLSLEARAGLVFLEQELDAGRFTLGLVYERWKRVPFSLGPR